MKITNNFEMITSRQDCVSCNKNQAAQYNITPLPVSINKPITFKCNQKKKELFRLIEISGFLDKATIPQKIPFWYKIARLFIHPKITTEDVRKANEKFMSPEVQAYFRQVRNQQEELINSSYGMALRVTGKQN